MCFWNRETLHIIEGQGLTCQSSLSGMLFTRKGFYASRWTVSGAKAGTQMATYSAPIGALAGLGPARRAAHVGHTDLRFLVVHAADVFFDDLVPWDGDEMRCGNEFGHVLFQLDSDIKELG